MEDDEESIPPVTRRRARGKGSKINAFPPVPSEEGRKLMDGGVFGASQCYRDWRKRKPRLANKLMMREFGLNDHLLASSVAQVCK